MKHSIIVRAAIIVGITVGAFGLSALADWQAPAAAPPTCATNSPGCDAPINVGSATQYKNGSLGLGALSGVPGGTLLDVFGTGVINDLWTNTFHVTGSAQTLGAGRVLTDVNGDGNVTWQAIPASSGGVTQIIAGSHITINPTTGKGTVTISSTNSVPTPEYDTCNISGGYNAGGSCTAVCSVGKHVLGGACTSPNSSGVSNSYPNSGYTGWQCTVGAAINGYVTGTGVAICE